MTAFISYEKYVNIKSNFTIKFPPFDLLDINSLITWNSIRKIGLDIKKKESISIDYISAV